MIVETCVAKCLCVCVCGDFVRTVGEDGIKLMEDYGSMSPEQMSVLLFRSLGALGARGKCFLMLLVSLLFAFFLLIPST